MLTLGLKSVDRVLRGEATTPAALAAAGRLGLDVPVLPLCVAIDALGLAYGFCMGVYDLTAWSWSGLAQCLATMFKVPALYLLTLAVTLPSLYVFNALVGSRLKFGPMLRLLVATIGVMVAVLAGLGPIVGFFSFTTSSYPFMLLLNVAVFALAGVLGMGFLLQTLHRLAVLGTTVRPFAAVGSATVEFPTIPETAAEDGTIPVAAPPRVPATVAGPAAAGALARAASVDHPLGRHVRTLFRVWVVVFAVVGAQMAYVLSPFLGVRGGPFTLFRATDSNFFAAVWHNVQNLLR